MLLKRTTVVVGLVYVRIYLQEIQAVGNTIEYYDLLLVIKDMH